MKKDKNSSSARAGGKKKQACTACEQPIVPSYMRQNSVKAPVDNTWHISTLYHMPLRSFVLDGTDYDASVVSTEKVFSTKQKARALTVPSTIIRKRVGNGATPAS